ncbi:hypothetical protein GLYMA_10G234300v4 [Glycine max]|uniref:Uncharacterized protein n=1 Tax=Glycine max TaxID=3847 RepID=A0A0R0HY32_SOYBN|nr:hypothetical protein GYH30_028897 [Glycine max]KRH35290.1 hypothetical protein GLYMA_10G234300v4 [Glycine max]
MREKWVVSSLSTQKAKCLSNLCKSPRSVFPLNPNFPIPFSSFFHNTLRFNLCGGLDHRFSAKNLFSDSKI